MAPTAEDTSQTETGMMEDEDIYIPSLKDILAVIEVDVWIDTDDLSKAHLIVDGFRYLMKMEFQRQQPLLALFYELEFANPSLKRGGSFHYQDKIILKLRSEGKLLQSKLDEAKKQIKESQEAAGKQLRAALLSVLIGVAPVIKPIIEAVIAQYFPPVHSQVENKLNTEHAPTIIKVKFEYREADGRDIFPKNGTWEL